MEIYGSAMYSVALLAVQNCMFSSLVGSFDIFSVASTQARSFPGFGKEPLFAPLIVGSSGGPLQAFNGMIIPLGATLADGKIYDIVLVPVIFGDLEPVLADREMIQWLAHQRRNGACLASSCAGSFLLAEAGILNGRTATTHWNLADNFAKRYPEVKLKREKMLVDEGECITAGGVSAYLDLALYLTARFGSPELAALLSKILLIDPGRRSQAPYQTAFFHKNHADAAILNLQEWLEGQSDKSLCITDLASRAGLGERTLLRRFKKATGDSPLEYLQRLRIEKARNLLETTAESVEEITRKTGYSDTSSFRGLFKRYTGLSPSAYRKRFAYRLPMF